MCGDSSRVAVGGTIAILKGKAVDNLPDISLLFNSNESASTTATFQSAANSAQKEYERCQIIIHRSGDLRLKPNPEDILHSFQVAPKAYSSQSNSHDSFQLPLKLDLGVGGDGIIGRRVSLVRRTSMGADVLRQGIIGWN
ncbi:hypothetical protein BDV97DRAFT_353212 [Delphinella strobiligena]|nr:hypothetical protein BDV97DRAFT_353212 [Delphinella strobiligena]